MIVNQTAGTKVHIKFIDKKHNYIHTKTLLEEYSKIYSYTKQTNFWFNWYNGLYNLFFSEWIARELERVYHHKLESHTKPQAPILGGHTNQSCLELEHHT